LIRLSLLTVLAIGACAVQGRAQSPVTEDWPQWRGPRGDGSSLEQNLPTHWSATENIAWKASVPGKGHSSPIVFGDRIFLTTCLEEKGERVLLCYGRADGKLLWQREVLRSPLEKKHDLNSFASATPCTDGKHVWVSFFETPKIVVACYDMAGNETWRKSPGTFSSIHGFCSSPVLYKDTLILNCDQDAPAYIVAFNKETGEERWRTDRPNRTRSYCTPAFFDVNGRKQMILSGSKCVTGYDADTGKLLWIVDGPTEQYVASLVMTDGVVFLTAGFPEHHLLGIDPTGTGDITKSPQVLWHEKKDHRAVSYVPSPVAGGHWFFLVSDGGIGTCWEAKTGKQLWKQPLSPHQSASGIIAGGNAYFTGDDGETTVFKAAPTFELVGKNPLGENCYASPAVSRGQIFIRTSHTLWCVGSAVSK
jgi:outer membrane protein assembly factor BamB